MPLSSRILSDSCVFGFFVGTVGGADCVPGGFGTSGLGGAGCWAIARVKLRRMMAGKQLLATCM